MTKKMLIAASILDTSLKIVLELLKDALPEQKQAIWADHLARMDKIEALFAKWGIGDGK